MGNYPGLPDCRFGWRSRRPAGSARFRETHGKPCASISFPCFVRDKGGERIHGLLPCRPRGSCSSFKRQGKIFIAIPLFNKNALACSWTFAGSADASIARAWEHYIHSCYYSSRSMSSMFSISPSLLPNAVALRYRAYWYSVSRIGARVHFIE